MATLNYRTPQAATVPANGTGQAAHRNNHHHQQKTKPATATLPASAVQVGGGRSRERFPEEKAIVTLEPVGAKTKRQPASNSYSSKNFSSSNCNSNSNSSSCNSFTCRKSKRRNKSNKNSSGN
uniref:Uncharacterized protein n=1 Tax=Anopheles dirus TaxID=7168 RepID=A0A182NW94_9DIPT